MKTVIHLHTNYSHDSNVSPSELVEAARREQVDCIAITDHDEIDGAYEARDYAQRTSDSRPIRVLIGEEVSSADGHILGLFLQERIEPGLSGEATIARIRQQGGLALAAHPFCTLCDSSLLDATERLAGLFDGVEVFNAQNPLPWQDRRALAFARRHNLATFVGVDGHLRGRMAPAYQWLREFSGPADFLEALRHGQPCVRRYGAWYLARMGLRHVWDNFSTRPLPGYGVNRRSRNAAVAR